MSVLERPDKPKKELVAGDPQAICSCGNFIVDPLVRHNWYWQTHSVKGCTLELPDLVCWCGLKRSEHIDGHKR